MERGLGEFVLDGNAKAYYKPLPTEDNKELIEATTGEHWRNTRPCLLKQTLVLKHGTKIQIFPKSQTQLFYTVEHGTTKIINPSKDTIGTVLKDLCHTLQATTKSDRGGMMTAGVIGARNSSLIFGQLIINIESHQKTQTEGEKKMVGCDFNCILGICCDMY